jgi:predicted nucleic acid-binding protein
VLVDSSVWIDFLRDTDNAESRLLVGGMRRGDPIWTAPPILQEVLQGADTPQRFAKWDRILGELPLLIDPDMRSLARAVGRLYASCRWNGVTPRSANDCLIAMYAVRSSVPLLHRDSDFVAIASVEQRLKLLPLNPQ